jgi:hypothetical protein
MTPVCRYLGVIRSSGYLVGDDLTARRAFPNQVSAGRNAAALYVPDAA